MCSMRWTSPEHFLSDPLVQFLGYQQFPLQESLGPLLFQHLPCGTTLGIPLVSFEGLAHEPVLQDSCAVLGIQADFCLAAKQNGVCPGRCPCAFVAHATVLIRGWRKVPVRR
jgi:hypothetical protein